MLKLLKIPFWIGWCICAVLLSTSAMAGVEPYENFLKGKINKNDSLIVRDEKFRNPSFNWSDINNISVNNAINLRILDEVEIKSNFSVEVLLKVQYFTDPAQKDPVQLDSVKLHVNYSKEQGANYKISDTYSFSNGYYVKLWIADIKSPEFGEDLPPVLQLSSSILIDRQYKFNPEMAIRPNVALVTNGQDKGTASGFASSSGPISENNQFQLSWPLVPGAEEYDIEWATVDSQSEFEPIIQQMLSGLAVPDDMLKSLFKNNATRITTHENNYLLSLVYNTQYVAVRMRQVQYTSDGIRLEGSWDYELDNDQYAVWPLKWHEPDLNWQYSAVFAEDGKKKEVISYFDGTLRGRQTATLNNSDNVAVVQENVYDEFGRATASILPAPVKEGSGTSYLHYFKNFNLNAANTPYSFENVRGSILDGCEFNPDPLNKIAGASRYYSDQNQFKEEKRYNKYIPDAEGFPLSVTEYTKDNTGRIKLQGGVGLTFQPGKSAESRTTKYYYSKPEQWELDRLFGNDAGFAAHYLKNIVADPNGQVSISYLNASGKTVATALAGPAPETQDALSTAGSPKLENVHLLMPDQFQFNGTALKLTATSTYFASVPDPAANFSYDIQKLISRYPGGDFQPCSNCYYDLDIKVMDDCNTTVYASSTPIKIGSETADPANTGLTSGNFNVNFSKIGEYYVTFELSMSRKVIDHFTEEYIRQGQENGAVKKESSFIMNYLKGTDISGSFSDCRTCNEALGEQEAFVARLTQSMLELEVDSTEVTTPEVSSWLNTLYGNLKTNCIALQENCYGSPCSDYEKLMLDDVAPNGQYALFDEAGVPLEAGLNAIEPNWRTEFPVAAEESALYESELIILDDGTSTSPYAADFTLSMLLQYWKDEWAAKFLKYHPEYCKLLFCQQNGAYLAWDKKVQAMDKASDLSTLGQSYQYNNPAWLLAADPFFKPTGAGAGYFNDMKADLEQYSTRILNYNAAPVKDLTAFVDYIIYCADTTGTTNSSIHPDRWTYCTPVTVCRIPDKEWQNYRDSYFEVKEKYYKLLRESGTCSATAGQVIGTPVTVPQPNVISVLEFGIESYTGDDGVCSSTERKILISYMSGNLAKAVSVKVYYPGGILNVPFAIGEDQKIICVPQGMPVSGIKISEVIQ